MSDSTVNSGNSDPFDPSNLASLRLSQDFSASAKVKPVLTSVACRKPHDQEFIRVRPGDENRFDTGCFVDKESREVYLVAPNLWDLMDGNVTPTSLVVCQSRNSKVPFLWPLKIPASDRPLKWYESAMEAADMARSQWLKVVSDVPAGQYVPHVSFNELPDPDWSNVPAMNELLRLAFKSRFIDSESHPVLRRLRGET